MNYIELKDYIETKEFESKLNVITNCDDFSNEKKRYLSLLEKAYSKYGDGDYHFISSPGRSEICGNHTDHQHGHVVACSLDINNVVIFKLNNTNICNYDDTKFDSISIDLSDLNKKDNELNTSKSLIKGIAYKLTQLGYRIGGFDAVCDSNVLIGSGISSSACFEVMIVEIFNTLFNENRVSDIERATISQYAENEYFGKPSGLMDQMTISVGGVVAIDFKNQEPVIDKHNFSFSDYGYELLLVNTKGNHSDLSHEYSSITKEMKDVCKVLGVEHLAETTYEKFIENISKIRESINNDRAILRTFHFFNEDKRAVEFKSAIKKKDISEILNIINKSGRSSFEYLQNVYPSSRTESQPLALALAIADEVLKENGAYRVHGGGFDGTVLAIVPSDLTKEFVSKMNGIFGENCVMKSSVSEQGTRVII